MRRFSHPHGVSAASGPDGTRVAEQHGRSGENVGVLPQRRLLFAVAGAALIAVPAAVLAGLCLGNACRRSDQTRSRVPFCSLPPELRSLIADGFRDARSPHVLALAGDTRIVGSSTSDEIEWPSLDDTEQVDVPVAFAGTGVSPGAEVPGGTTLDAVAPTLAEIIGLRRPHPGVRSGTAVSGLASGGLPRLAVLVAWKNVSSRELERRPQTWPVLRGLIEDGSGTLAATPGSLPLDPAAILATIGTGGLPRDHGITGSHVRNDQGVVVPAWGEDAPFSVIAALGDDLDEMNGQAPRVGLVGTEVSDRGLIGGNWYVEHDRDDVVMEPDPAGQATAAESLLASGYGGDAMTDLMAVAAEGAVPKLDAALGRILLAAERVSGGSFVLAVTSTGSAPSDRSEGFPASELESEISARVEGDVIEAFAPGGVFLDQDAMTRTGLSDDRVVAAMRGIETPDGEPLFADVFPAIAVTFARYC